MTAGQFHRPKAAEVVNAFEKAATSAPTVFVEKTSKKQGGTMFNVPPPTKAQRENKQQIVYSRAVPK